MDVKSIRQMILPAKGSSQQSPDERQRNPQSQHDAEPRQDDAEQPVKAPPPADMGHHVDKTV